MKLVKLLRTVLSTALAAVLLAALTAAVPAARASAASPARSTAVHQVGYDKYSVTIDGQRVMLWSGEFHYWRLPSPDLWRDVLQKIKASGMNAVSIYFDWAYHSPARGTYDFTGVRDVDKLLDMAQEAGLYVIARPGPYINAETDGGGFPGWLTTQKGRARSTDPDYLDAAHEWLRHIDTILARHQVSNGTGPVLLYQVENELYDPDGRAYMVDLSKQARSDGITVPLVGNEPEPQYAGGEGLDFVGALDQYNAFCQGPWWVPDLTRPDATKPLAVFEAGTGWFQTWGDTGYDKCRQTMGPAYQKIVNKAEIMQGTTIENLYMAYGGTNWGWLADPRQVYTSYDYGAPITEARQTGADYDELKRQGLFYTTTAPLTKTEPVDAPASSDETASLTARANPDTGTQFLYLRHADATAGSDTTTRFNWQTPDGTYPVSVRLNGQTGKILVAGYDLGGQRLVYSTSELMTSTSAANRDVALLYGADGDPGQTVLRYASKPAVTVLDGTAKATWDADHGDLKLDYTHSGLTRILIHGGGRRDLMLLVGTDDQAADFWRPDGSTLVRGTELVRTATARGSTLALTGDASKAGPLEVFASPAVRNVTWNGSPVTVRRTASGSLLGSVPGPKDVKLPQLTHWKKSTETPEVAPAFDDSSWTYADKLTTDNPTRPGTLPVPYQDEYGYHYGYVWYRGHFTASGTEKSLSLTAYATNPDTSSRAVGAYSVWINGKFAGTSETGRHTFPLHPGLLHKGADNVVSVLVGTMGHNEDFAYAGDDHKQPRGLTAAYLSGSDARITWRIQGARGGEQPVDTARGAMNTGGLYGERSGWTLPGYPDQKWQDTSLPASDTTPGIAWYRTSFTSRMPAGQDVSVGVTIADDAQRDYRALIYVNGWLMGQYVNDTGPQHTFPVPNGILRADGRNTIAIASWNEDGTSGGLGKVTLTRLGNVTSSLRVADVRAPSYDAAVYAQQATAATVGVDAPDIVEPGGTYQVTATVAVPRTGRALRGTVLSLTGLPDGWTATPQNPVQVGTVKPGATAEARWTLDVPADQATDAVLVLKAKASFNGGSVTGEKAVAAQPPPLTAGEHYISDLPFRSSSNGWGPVERDQSNGENAEGDGLPLTLHDTTYAKGLGTHAASSAQVWLGGSCTTFHAALGLDQETYGRSDGPATVDFTVLADGEQVYDSGTVDRDTDTKAIDVDVSGARQLELVVSDAGDGNALDHADWADAKVTCGGGA
ncbi:beta-galactosidase [Streptomyces sp. STR69]|uniref:beta-galactosidase n=1 Tax=Streptomyces sp. STR69 TaxID=1796942 RepID=UPI0021C7BA17|nr:beta-galactosidase [Streptomyces sp. STR69]